MELRQKEDNEVEENLECFWKDSSILLKYAPPGHLLHDIAKFDVIVKEDCLPENMLDAMDAEKKVAFNYIPFLLRHLIGKFKLKISLYS